MSSMICSRLQLCPVSDVVSVTKNSVTLKEGRSMIKVTQKKLGNFTIKSIPSPGGYRKDFVMQSVLPTPEANTFYKYKRSLILLLTTSDGETITIGSPDFPVKAEFSGNNSIVTVDFKQSQPG